MIRSGCGYRRHIANQAFAEDLIFGSLDEWYHAANAVPVDAYDGLNRLREFDRGTLNADRTGLTTTLSESRVTYGRDSQGNWTHCRDASGNWVSGGQQYGGGSQMSTSPESSVKSGFMKVD